MTATVVVAFSLFLLVLAVLAAFAIRGGLITLTQSFGL